MQDLGCCGPSDCAWAQPSSVTGGLPATRQISAEIPFCSLVFSVSVRQRTLKSTVQMAALACLIKCGFSNKKLKPGDIFRVGGSMVS